MRSYRYFSLFFAYLILGVVFLQQPALAQEAEAEAESDSSRPIRDKWAVVIGIDKFKDQTIPQLRYSAKDAKDFGQFLVEKGNFAFDHVKVLINESATENNILDVLGGNWLPRRVLPDDLVVVFVSTHGSPKEIDIAGENFLIAHDTYRDKLYASAIKLEDLGPGIQRRTRCSRVVLLLDACNSGAADVSSKGLNRNLNFDLEKLNALAGEGLVVISSSSADQKSWESKRYRNGVFTRKLIETLST
ncbi:MAG: caspase family protein, partial [Candidatus Obscuribacterales bacterium]|nr:caspase family protein [Candidatus Obscuribacterales bacterium]